MNAERGRSRKRTRGGEKREKGTLTDINDARERKGCGANVAGIGDVLCQTRGMGGGPGHGFNFSALGEMISGRRSDLSNLVIMTEEDIGEGSNGRS